MDEFSYPKEWVVELSRNYSLEESLVIRLLEEFLAQTDETLDAYVSRRHLELQRQGLDNEKIYTVLQGELETKRFKAKRLSLRQIRRIIYG